MDYSPLDSVPFTDECKRLIARVLAQAVLDYVNFTNHLTQVDEEDFLTASGLIFDSEYKVLWGEEELSIEQMCTTIGVELDWFRDKVNQKTKQLTNKGNNPIDQREQ